MSNFSKIAQSILSNNSIHTVPFLNFEYSARREEERVMRRNLDAFDSEIKRTSRDLEAAERRIKKLNKEALSRVLTDQEAEELSNLFTQIDKNASKLHMLTSQYENLSNG